MLKPKKKSQIISQYQKHKEDSGSAEVQIALFSQQIKELTRHLKKHPQDNHSRRGLLKMVSKRRRLLDYLKNENERRYNRLIKKLGLKR